MQSDADVKDGFSCSRDKRAREMYEPEQTPGMHDRTQPHEFSPQRNEN